jgi:hypothetical protein
VLRLSAWADRQAATELANAPDHGGTEWRDSRVNTLRLLRADFRQGATEGPGSLSESAWAIIESAAADPDPSPCAEASAYEADSGPDLTKGNHACSGRC